MNQSGDAEADGLSSNSRRQHKILIDKFSIFLKFNLRSYVYFLIKFKRKMFELLRQKEFVVCQIYFFAAILKLTSWIFLVGLSFKMKLKRGVSIILIGNKRATATIVPSFVLRITFFQ